MIDTSAFQGKKAVYHTLGCKLNFSETSTFGKMLEEMGVRTAVDGETADICLINTCSVTEIADRKCRQAIRRIVKDNPGAFVVVTGCYAQLEPQKLLGIDGVNLVLGSNEKANLIDYLSREWTAGKTGEQRRGAAFAVKTKDIRTFQHSCSLGGRTRYCLKVQDGCDYYCTYCTIPMARGNSRNPTIASLVEQVKGVVDEGGKEIVLTGVNIGDFGKTTGERFIDLVRALDGVEGMARYRISSLEPDLISDELIDFCAASSKFMPHFHIPLQSGSDAVLRLMHRRYDSALFAEKVTRIKSLMPDTFIGVDVMVGTRGETAEFFEETYALLERLPVSQLHVFPYSERPGTAALRIPYVVSPQEQKARCQRLLALSDKKTAEFYRHYIGHTRPVLFERAPQGKVMHGFTDNYIRVELPARLAKADYDNEIMNVRLGEMTHDGSALRAEIIGDDDGTECGE